MNKVLQSGTIFKDIKYYEASGGKKSYIRFTLATQDDFKAKNQEKYGYQYLPCEAYGQTADFIFRNFKEGSAIEITDAELRNNNYEKDGVAIYGLVITIKQVQFTPKDFGQKAVREIAQPTFTEPDNAYKNDEESDNHYRSDHSVEIPKFTQQ